MPVAKVQYNVKKKISDLKVWGKNPNEMEPEEFEALKKSLKRFGYLEPIVIDEKGNILGGNHRTIAMAEMNGADSDIICTIITGLSDEEKDKLGLALNKIHGENNPIKLKELLAGFSVSSDLIDLGFSPTELKDLDIDLDSFSTDEGLFESPREIKTTVIICPHCGEKIEKAARDVNAGMKKYQAAEK